MSVAKLDLAAIGKSEITEFLGDLAVPGNVAASTQNQAFNALLHTYQHVVLFRVSVCRPRGGFGVRWFWFGQVQQGG